MVTLDTFRALHEHDHKLACYCPTCERWAVLDLERLIAQGPGEYRFVGRKPRCSYCRGPGIWHFRPPALRPAIGVSRVHLKLLPRPAAIGCGFNRSTQHIDYRATTPHITIRPAEAGRNVIAEYGLAPVQLATGTMPEVW